MIGTSGNHSLHSKSHNNIVIIVTKVTVRKAVAFAEYVFNGSTLQSRSYLMNNGFL